MARHLLVLLVAALTAAAPLQARAGGCDRNADRLFAHPYGEPAGDCSEPDPTPDFRARARERRERDEFFDDHRGERRLQMMGITGMGAGASLAGAGGVAFLLSRLLSKDTNAREVTGDVGVGLAIAGGALFVAGAALVGIDLLTAPAPTPDGRGAQLVLALDF